MSATVRLADLTAKIKAAADDRAVGEISAHAGEIMTLLREQRIDPSPDQTRTILGACRSAQAFNELGGLAELFLRQGVETTFVRRQQAQAMIEAKQLTPAIAYLREIEKRHRAAAAAEPSHADHKGWARELTDVVALRGRALKQIYCDDPIASGSSPRDAAEPVKQALCDAAAAYWSVFDRQNIADSFYPGINAIAVIARARVDGIEILQTEGDDAGRDYPATETLARQMIDALAGLQEADVTPWVEATRGEALLALRDFRGAETAFERYADHPGVDGFALSSTLRQLREVWRLSEENDADAALLLRIASKAMWKVDGALDFSPAKAHALLVKREAENQPFEHLMHLQGVSGGMGPARVDWLLDGIRRSQSVGRVNSRLDGRTRGSGFLIDPTLFGFDPSERLFLTNAHVIAEAPQVALALRPGEAFIEFGRISAGSPGAMPAGSNIGEVVWTSPIQELDATLVRLEPDLSKTDALEALPFDLAPTEIDALPDDARDAIVIGYPMGGDLSISLNETEIIDIGFRSPEFEDFLHVHYRTPTLKGSSGSPVFYAKTWRVLALHRAGVFTPTEEERQLGMTPGVGIRKLNGAPGVEWANQGVMLRSIVERFGDDAPAEPGIAPVIAAGAAVAALAAQVTGAIGAAMRMEAQPATDTPASPSSRPPAPPPSGEAQAQSAPEEDEIADAPLPPRLEALLNGPVGDAAARSELAASIEIDWSASRAFAPKPRLPGDPSVPAAALERRLAAFEHQRLLALYARRRDGAPRLIIVGDGWARSPLLASDLTEALSDRYAVHPGLARPFVDLASATQDAALLSAAMTERPSAVVLSGGGASLFSADPLAEFIAGATAISADEVLLGRTFAARLAGVEAGVRRAVEAIHAAAAPHGVAVLVHGYDRPTPRPGGGWLGGPLAQLGVADPSAQQALVRSIVDQLNLMLARVARQTPGMLHVDCRGALSQPSHWADELHPSAEGCARLADRLHMALTARRGPSV